MLHLTQRVAGSYCCVTCRPFLPHKSLPLLWSGGSTALAVASNPPPAPLGLTLTRLVFEELLSHLNQPEQPITLLAGLIMFFTDLTACLVVFSTWPAYT